MAWLCGYGVAWYGMVGDLSGDWLHWVWMGWLGIFVRADWIGLVWIGWRTTHYNNECTLSSHGMVWYDMVRHLREVRLMEWIHWKDLCMDGLTVDGCLDNYLVSDHIGCDGIVELVGHGYRYRVS